MPGFNQSKNGTMNGDVCWTDNTFVEPIKVSTSQPNTGSQYLKKDFIKDQHGNAEHPTSNTERPMAERDSASPF